MNRNRASLSLVLTLSFLASSCASIKETMNETMDRADVTLQRAQSTLMVQQADFQRTIGMSIKELDEISKSRTQEVGELLTRLSIILDNAVLLAGSEVQCSIATVNSYARDAVADLRHWWRCKWRKCEPLPPRSPLFCHFSSLYVDVEEFKTSNSPVLVARGLGMDRDDIGFVVVGAKERFEARSEWIAQNRTSASLNVSKLIESGHLNCDSTKIQVMWNPRKGKPERLGEILTGCKPPPPPSCPGGAPMENGFCLKCSFKVGDLAAKAISASSKGEILDPPMKIASLTCPNIRQDIEYTVTASGSVNIFTGDPQRFGHWGRWLDASLGVSGGPTTACSNGETSHAGEFSGTHAVNLCSKIKAASAAEITAQVLIRRCKQGDAQAVCRLESDFVLEISASR